MIDLSDKYSAESKGKIDATLLLWKQDGAKWTDNELMPVKQIKIADDQASVCITLRDGTRKEVKFKACFLLPKS